MTNSFDANSFQQLRDQMVARQLIGRGITDPLVIEAMRKVPREQFVAAEYIASAYEDRPLPIGCGQTISQPFTVAFMCEAAQLKGNERVLEIGTGSGYGAAVLGKIAREVHSVERIPELAARAQTRLAAAGYDNVHVHCDDGTVGLAEEAPFDAIIVTAGGETLPPEYRDQVAPGGRIVIPLGAQRFRQRMYRFTKTADGLETEDLGGFAFVPLIGVHGWAGSV